MSPMCVRAQWHTRYDSDTSIILLPICIIQCISCSLCAILVNVQTCETVYPLQTVLKETELLFRVDLKVELALLRSDFARVLCHT